MVLHTRQPAREKSFSAGRLLDIGLPFHELHQEIAFLKNLDKGNKFSLSCQTKELMSKL
jgi:hypothetical protein